MKALQAATFLGEQFDSCRPAYRAALRRAATDADERLRRRSLDILSNLKDEFARERVIAGLTGEAAALVPPAVALGLLARDDHASTVGLARDFLAKASDRFVRAQAVRLLSADPSALPLFEKLMSDKGEFREVRQASAAALRNLDPGAFFSRAKAIAADDEDFEDIRRTVRSALDRAGVPVPPVRRQEVPTMRRLIEIVRRWVGGESTCGRDDG